MRISIKCPIFHMKLLNIIILKWKFIDGLNFSRKMEHHKIRSVVLGRNVVFSRRIKMGKKTLLGVGILLDVARACMCAIVRLCVHVTCELTLITKVEVFSHSFSISISFFSYEPVSFLLAHRFDWIPIGTYGMGSFVQPTHKAINCFINWIHRNVDYRSTQHNATMYAFVWLILYPIFPHIKLFQNWISNIASTFPRLPPTKRLEVLPRIQVHSCIFVPTVRIAMYIFTQSDPKEEKKK